MVGNTSCVRRSLKTAPLTIIKTTSEDVYVCSLHCSDGSLASSMPHSSVSSTTTTATLVSDLTSNSALDISGASSTPMQDPMRFPFQVCQVCQLSTSESVQINAKFSFWLFCSSLSRLCLFHRRFIEGVEYTIAGRCPDERYR